MNQPVIKVGIMSSPSITVVFHGRYTLDGKPVESEVPLTLDAAMDGEPIYMPAEPDTGCFEVRDVTIGVNFHWQRREDQMFRGAASFIREQGMITLVNHVPAEDYLLSVISSEMNAEASEEFLKAHAVISRSWLLAQTRSRGAGPRFESCVRTPGSLIRWYDHTDHARFDVCADDHCQRYQGICRQTTDTVRRAVEATSGEVLVCDGELVDARFSKCCGGVFEEFENCWEPVHHSYLVARRDSAAPDDFPDLRVEDEARKWIHGHPDAFCADPSPEVLAQVLNSYDRETSDFYRWTVEYSRDEIAGLIRRRSGIDFGDIIDLVPLERGTSGRIVRLKIVGTLRTMVIGKELEIRRTLSESHLYSSAFTVERRNPDAAGVPGSFVLRGAGWGHGVGLCQIGAAVMGARGYGYRDILAHYFTGAEISKLY